MQVRRRINQSIGHGPYRKRSRGLLLFAVMTLFLLTVCCLYHAGNALLSSMRLELSVKFYNGVLRVYLPGYMSVQGEGQTGVYQDVTASMYPSLAANEQILWYESQAEDMANYENLAKQENSRTQMMLAENESAQAEKETEADSGQSRQQTEQQNKEERETPQREEAAADAADSGADSAKKASVNRKKLQDFDYLLQKFYQVDNTTTINSKLLNADKLLAYDLTVDTHVDGPVILIYHTHSQEGYKDSVKGDSSTTVVGLGDYLTKLLEERGYAVLHDTGAYDLPERDRAYSCAAPSIEKILEENPSIQVVIDLHRDGVNEDVHLVTEQNGKKMAKIMFFNGLSHTTALGDIPYLKNPYIEDNLAFSLQMQIAAAEYYPGFTRRIYLKGYRFNMHFRPKSLLVEVGAQTNTVEEAMNAMEPLADLLDKVLAEKTE